ncbi:hypothetical protein Dvar_63110 [Desulfosarcina variabilis str. Montpellier]|uniref:DUF6178 family protein n=1 Tax=Desulfosarcina variabilis TaxID=2300 RepID=UPI003AFB4D9D
MIERAVAPKRPVDLLNRILESPRIVKIVQELPPPVLTRLVRHVGLEDAAEIVAMATGEQLSRVFDEDLWVGPRPGKDEIFDAGRFILWLEVLFENGLESAMEKIVRFDEDLITLALTRHIRVLDMDALSVHIARRDRGDKTYLVDKVLDGALSLEFEGYLVIAKPHCGWDVISTMLIELNQADEAMLDRLLRHCSRISADYIEDNGGLYDVLTAEEMLTADLAGEHQEHRQKDGYVPPASAVAFLEQARSQPLAQHVAKKQWHYDTRRYFKSLNTDTAKTAAADTAISDPTINAERQRVQELLQEAEILESPVTQRQLPSGESHPESMPLARAMRALRENGSASDDQRLAETTYLANVLIAGCPIYGRRFRPMEAAKAVMATCQLGAEHVTGLCLTTVDDKDLANLTTLLVNTDMVRLFNCGWRILHERIGMPAARCLAELMRQVDDNLHGKRRRYELAVKRLSLNKKIRANRPWLFVPEIDDLLGEVDNAVLAQLSDLISEYPLLPPVLQRPEDIARLPVIRTGEQVALIKRFLIELTPSAN